MTRDYFWAWFWGFLALAVLALAIYGALPAAASDKPASFTLCGWLWVTVIEPELGDSCGIDKGESVTESARNGSEAIFYRYHTDDGGGTECDDDALVMVTGDLPRCGEVER
jgi:hypothetical protein